MNVARINCAHDDERTWEKMIGLVKKAGEATGLSCSIYMDLAGPKIRTVIRGKKKKPGKMAIAEGMLLTLVEDNAARHAGKTVVGCSLNGIVRYLKKGHRVLFDDGAIEAVVEHTGPEIATLRLTRVSTHKPFLKAEKGINFPDTAFAVPALTDYDRQCLPFIRRHANMVGYSFVEDESSLAMLQGLLDDGSGGKPFIILKIEKAAAVQNLPGLLLQGMREKAFGIMIARGDLAVEIGFERLSEIQEEILWLSEAAHVPVIWATQVFETLNRTGLATRSEVTDAAYAFQSECVMINKGEHLLKVMDILKDILRRSGGHHLKKRYLFRPLNIAVGFMQKLSVYPGSHRDPP
jgi:pyruvate kinase